VQPILDQYAMGIIQKLELKEVAFGNKAPEVTGIVHTLINLTDHFSV